METDDPYDFIFDELAWCMAPRSDREYTKRKLFGILGMIFPLLLILLNGILANNWTVEGSISAYYYTDLQYFFMGFMILYGILLIWYQGYPDTKKDNLISTFSGIFAIILAVIPTSPSGQSLGLYGMIHIASATAFLFTLGIISFFYFSKGRHGIRSFIYRLSGILIFLSIGLSFYVTIYQISTELNPVFWVETVAIESFGFAWWVKGLNR